MRNITIFRVRERFKGVMGDAGEEGEVKVVGVEKIEGEDTFELHGRFNHRNIILIQVFSIICHRHRDSCFVDKGLQDAVSTKSQSVVYLIQMFVHLRVGH